MTLAEFILFIVIPAFGLLVLGDRIASLFTEKDDKDEYFGPY